MSDARVPAAALATMPAKGRKSRRPDDLLRILGDDLDVATANYATAQDREFEALYKKASAVARQIAATPAATIEGCGSRQRRSRGATLSSRSI